MVRGRNLKDLSGRFFRDWWLYQLPDEEVQVDTSMFKTIWTSTWIGKKQTIMDLKQTNEICALRHHGRCGQVGPQSCYSSKTIIKHSLIIPEAQKHRAPTGKQNDGHH